MNTPSIHLHNEIDKFIEELRTKLHEKADEWATIRQPEEMFPFSQELQNISGRFQSEIVGGVLEAIHLDLDFVVSCQTQALMGGLRNVEWRPVSIQTLGGEEIIISSPYAARKRKKVGRPRKKRGKGGSGDYPVLRRLGIVGRATPALLAEVNRQVADGPKELEVQQRLATRGIVLDTKTIRRYVRDFASIALWQRQATALEDVQALECSPLSGKRVVLATDGGRIRTRVNKKGRKRKSGRHGFKTDWREPKLFVIYTIDEQGRKERYGELASDSTLEPADEFFNLITLQLKELGINQAESLTILGDGASWIWKQASELITILNLQIPVIQILDFRHAVEKMITAVKASSLTQQQIKVWVKRIKKWLKKGKVDKIIDALSTLDNSNDTEQQIRRAIDYCRTHYHRMQYADFISQNLPTGSGAIESGIRRIVNLRIKGPGIFWLQQNAERVLHLRSKVKSGNWSDFVKSVLTKWAAGFTVSLAQVRQDV